MHQNLVLGGNGGKVDVFISDFGNSPGHYASEGGYPKCLNCFLQHDGEIDIQNIKGDTPLDTARKFGHPLLMEKGGI